MALKDDDDDDGCDDDDGAGVCIWLESNKIVKGIVFGDKSLCSVFFYGSSPKRYWDYAGGRRRPSPTSWIFILWISFGNRAEVLNGTEHSSNRGFPIFHFYVSGERGEMDVTVSKLNDQ